MVFVPALGSYWGPYVSWAVSNLLSALIVGYIFAGKIWEEARVESIARMTVLAAALMIFYLISLPSFADWAPTVKEAYQAEHPGATLSPREWLTVEGTTLAETIFIDIVIVLAFGLVGLYVGSMLRRPSGK